MRIALIICYFGKWPPWFDLFLESCKINPSVNFLFFTDCAAIDRQAENIKFVPFTLSQFNKLASEALNLKIEIQNPYKLCDFKPAYGLIFADYLKIYDFWGHTDLDILFGNIKSFITDDLLNEYDIISPKREYLVGHFTLYKNRQKTNELFKMSIDHEKIFTSPEIFSFDECNYLWFQLLKGIPLKELKSDIISMTHIVRYFDEKKYLKAYFKTCIIEQEETNEKGDLIDFNEILMWEEGKLKSITTNKEYMYFHFHFLKRKPDFLIPEWQTIPATFYVSAKGFLI